MEGTQPVRLASGSELCVIQARPRKTGLKVELSRFDPGKEEFVVSGSVIIKGKKGSTKTDLVAAACVENKAVMMPYVYLLVRHCYSDKDPLYAFGFITTEELDPAGQVTFICIREFRDAALHAGGRVWILHGPVVVAEGSPNSRFLFFGCLTHTPEGLPKFVTSQVISPPHARLITCACVDPKLALPCEQYALFIGRDAGGDTAKRKGGDSRVANFSHFLKKGVLDGLGLDYFADGGRMLSERFGGPAAHRPDDKDEDEPNQADRWIVVPLPSADTIESCSEDALGTDGSPLPSPILTMNDAEEDDMIQSSPDMMEAEDRALGLSITTGQKDDRSSGGSLGSWIPNAFANPDAVAVVAFAESEPWDESNEARVDGAEDISSTPSIYLGTRSNELVTISNGKPVSCQKLPLTPLSIVPARVNNDDAVLVIKYEDNTVHIRHKDGTLLQEIGGAEDVLVGDFLIAGREQILVFHPTKLLKGGKPSKKDHFTLTDLRATYSFPKTKGQTAKEGSYSQSLQWVAYSLHCRLREGRQFLAVGRERFEAKKLLFNHAVRVLLEVAKEEGSCIRIDSPYLANIRGEKNFADGLVSLLDDDEPEETEKGDTHEREAEATVRVESLVAAFLGGEWVVTATVRNTHASQELWCQGILVSGPVAITTKASEAFEDRIRLAPQSSVMLTALASGNFAADTVVDVWLKSYEPGETETARYGCLGSLTLRAREQLAARVAPVPFADRSRMSILLTADKKTHDAIPSLIPTLQEVLPVSSSAPSDTNTSLRATESNRPFRVDLRRPPGAPWMCIDICAPSSSYVSLVLPLVLSAVPQGIAIRPNALAGLELVWQLSRSLSDELASLSALIEDILERNRSRRKLLKIHKITREEVDAQIELKRRYVEKQARSDELFGYFLRNAYFSEKKHPLTSSAHSSHQ